MSGRKLGRLLGSLLVLAALGVGGLASGLVGGGEAQTSDLIWVAEVTTPVADLLR